MATVTKAELATLLNEKVGLNRQESKEMVQAFFDEMIVALVTGDSLKLSVRDATRKRVRLFR